MRIYKHEQLTETTETTERWKVHTSKIIVYMHNMKVSVLGNILIHKNHIQLCHLTEFKFVTK